MPRGEGIDTLVIERTVLGRQAAAQWLDNVPGLAKGHEG